LFPYTTTFFTKQHGHTGSFTAAPCPAVPPSPAVLSSSFADPPHASLESQSHASSDNPCRAPGSHSRLTTDMPGQSASPLSEPLPADLLSASSPTTQAHLAVDLLQQDKPSRPAQLLISDTASAAAAPSPANTPATPPASPQPHLHNSPPTARSDNQVYQEQYAGLARLLERDAEESTHQHNHRRPHAQPMPQSSAASAALHPSLKRSQLQRSSTQAPGSEPHKPLTSLMAMMPKKAGPRMSGSLAQQSPSVDKVSTLKVGSTGHRRAGSSVAALLHGGMSQKQQSSKVFQHSRHLSSTPTLMAHPDKPQAAGLHAASQPIATAAASVPTLCPSRNSNGKQCGRAAANPMQHTTTTTNNALTGSCLQEHSHHQPLPSGSGSSSFGGSNVLAAPTPSAPITGVQNAATPPSPFSFMSKGG